MTDLSLSQPTADRAPKAGEPPRPDFDGWLDVERLIGRTSVTTGEVGVLGGRVWWMRVGDGGGIPLVVLHGGPGSGHDALLPLAALSDQRPVVFYDQLGCGRSDAPEDPSIYTIQRSVDELSAIRTALGLHRIDLFGHSWGSILAIEYLCQGRGAGVRRLILSGALSSVPCFAAGARRLLDRVREELVATTGTEPGEDELEAAFSARHFCRADPHPANVERSGAIRKSSVAYRVMNGPNEYTITGVIRDWDRTADLDWIKVPTLVTTGEYDEVSPEVTDALVGGVPDASLATFAGCSHLAIDEDPIAYLRLIRSFLES